MLRAKKGNRVVRIPDEKMDEYKALGYTITDMTGKMIYEHVEPSKKLEEAEKKIAALEGEIDAMKKAEAENADLKKAEKKIAALEKENAALKEELANIAGYKDQEPPAEASVEATAATAGKDGKGKAAGGTK